MKTFITSGLPDLPPGLPDKEYNLVAPLYRGINTVAQKASQQTNAVQYSEAELAQIDPLVALKTFRNNRMVVKAGEALSYGHLVYLDFISGKLTAFKADNNKTTGKPAVGCVDAVGGLATGAFGEIVFLAGICPGISGSTPGQQYYLGSAGVAVNVPVPGAIQQLVGIGLGTAGLYLSVAATGETYQAGELKYLPEFGAIGDGLDATATINDTAITAALAYIASTGNNVIVPPGVYKCNPFSVFNTSYASQGVFVGTDRERCVFKRVATGTDAFVTIGSSAATLFASGLGMSNITIDGGATTNGPAFRGYDIVRSSYESCHFKGGSIACELLGGISVSFTACLFAEAKTGVKIDKFTSSAGGGWPNAISFNGGEIVDNSEWGLWFDGGRLVTLNSIDVEGNGTTPGSSSHGGIYVGPNIGLEVAVNDTVSPGLVLNSCWMEANRGIADVIVNSGITTISACNFFSTAAQVTNDIVINAHQYSIRDTNCSFSKTANLLEGAGISSGNLITTSQIPNISWNPAKTVLAAGNQVLLNSGAAVSLLGYANGGIQAGLDATMPGTWIPFATPYSSAPLIMLTMTQTPDMAQVTLTAYDISTTGFRIFKSYTELTGVNMATGLMLADAAIPTMWLALGVL